MIRGRSDSDKLLMGTEMAGLGLLKGELCAVLLSVGASDREGREGR